MPPRPARPAVPGRDRAATARDVVLRSLVRLAVRSCVRLRVEGLGHLPAGPAVLCFSHQCWLDPFVVMAALPVRMRPLVRSPRLVFFGPIEGDMTSGVRNRVMAWSRMVVPCRPGAEGFHHASRRAAADLEEGAWLAIAGEGRCHVGESELLPLWPGAAYLALRSGVPLVPVAVNGTSWLAFGRTVRIRVGAPLAAGGGTRIGRDAAFPTRREVADLTRRLDASLRALVRGFPDRDRPGPIGAWLTELFNDWPEGARPEGPSGIGPARQPGSSAHSRSSSVG